MRSVLYSNTPKVDVSADMRIKYIKKVMNDLQVMSFDTLELAARYIDETGLYLPLLGSLKDLRTAAVENGDEKAMNLSYGFRNDMVKYLQQRLEQLEAESTDSEKGQIRAEVRESALLATEYIRGILVAARFVTENGATEFAACVAQEMALLKSRYGEIAMVSGANEKSLAMLESALNSGDLAKADSILSSIGI